MLFSVVMKGTYMSIGDSNKRIDNGTPPTQLPPRVHLQQNHFVSRLKRGIKQNGAPTKRSSRIDNWTGNILLWFEINSTIFVAKETTV